MTWRLYTMRKLLVWVVLLGTLSVQPIPCIGKTLRHASLGRLWFKCFKTASKDFTYELSESQGIEKVLAEARLTNHHPSVYFKWFGVHPHNQYQHIGTFFLEHILQDLRLKRIESIYLHSLPEATGFWYKKGACITQDANLAGYQPTLPYMKISLEPAKTYISKF
jgi:hypothetical protein